MAKEKSEKKIKKTSVFSRIKILAPKFGKWIWEHKIPVIITIVVLFLLFNIISFFSREQIFVTIGPGERGVVFNRFGGGVSDKVLGEGTHFVFPGFRTVYRARVSRQSAVIERITADSAEFQDVALWLNVEFQLSEEHLPGLFREFGAKSSADIKNDMIYPNVNEVTKVIIVKYPIGDVLLHQPEIKLQISSALRDVLKQYYINVIDVNIVNVRLAPGYREIVAQTEFAGYENRQTAIRLETRPGRNPNSGCWKQIL